jgi:SAM-dependent methyltransferase
MNDSVMRFYDRLARDYHHIFADWKQSVQRQGEALGGLISAQTGSLPLTALDCTCGIGTQAIGLALYGYTVHGTDLSPEAIERARQEARNFGVTVTFRVADLLQLEEQVPGTFDVVLSCDNALAHFLTDDVLEHALHHMAAKLVPNGLLLASIRDYDAILQEKPRTTLPQVSDNDGNRAISFQVWDWLGNGHTYTLNHFIVKQVDDAWQTTCNVTSLRAWRRAEVQLLLARAGLSDIQWHMPTDSGFYQPIVTAHKPN